MKELATGPRRNRSQSPLPPPPKPTARLAATRYPAVSVIRLRSRVWVRLAWVFGLGR